jgi:hypothetical protein
VGSSVNITIRIEVTVPKILKMVDLLIGKNLAALKLGTFVVKMVRSRSRSCRISQSTIPKELWENRTIIFRDSSTILSHVSIIINVGPFNSSKP